MTKILINNNLVVKLIGEIDHSNSNKYRHEIDDEIKRRPVRNLIFDFKERTLRKECIHCTKNGKGVIVKPATKKTAGTS